MRPSTAAVHIGFARSKETICVYCDTGLGLLPKRGYHHITKRGCALSVHLPLTNHLQFRKPIHKSFYHATRDIHEKISSNIFFQRPTFLIKRLHLQHVVATDSLKHLDDCYEYHSKTRYRDTLKKVRSIWWSADFKEPLTGQVFQSGRFNENDYQKLMRNIGVSDIDLEIYDTIEKDCRIYHKKKYISKEAVASTVLKSFVLKGDLDKNALERFCMEEPYMGRGNDYLLTPPSMIAPKFGSLRGVINFLYSRAVLDHQLYQSLSSKNSFEYESLELPALDRSGCKSIWFTASFTSPLTGEKFHSGSFYTLDIKSSENFIPLITHKILGRVYYLNKADAEEAAIARALDCFVLRGMVEQSSIPLARLENIKVNMNKPTNNPIPTASSASCDNKATMHSVAQDIESESKEWPSGSTISMTESSTHPNHSDIEKKHLPLTCIDISGRVSSLSQLLLSSTILSRLYVISCVSDDSLIEDSYQYYEELFPSHLSNGLINTWYSATFRCPITGETYDSMMSDNSRLLSGNEIPSIFTQSKDGKIYYSDKAQSKEAAAAKALSTLITQSKVGSNAFERLCVEAPYEAPDNVYPLFQVPRDRLSNQYATVILHLLYRLNYPKQADLYSDGFTYSCHLLPSLTLPNIYNQWWTCTFKCPITGEEFDAGILNRLDFGSAGSSKYSTRASDRKNYYRKKSESKEAAASRALDCFISRGCLDIGSSATLGQRVLDQTINLPSQSIVPSNNQSSTVSQRTLQTVQEPIKHSIEDSVGHLSSEMMVPHMADSVYDGEIPKICAIETYSNEKISPKTILLDYFVGLHRDNDGGTITNNLSYHTECMRTSFHILDPTLYDYWTSTFTDPQTGEIFASGILADIESYYVDSKNVEEKDASSPPFYFTMDNKVYYRQKKLAEQAAAARVVDSYYARGLIKRGSNFHRYCTEDPEMYPMVQCSPEPSLLKIDNEADDFVVRHIPGAVSSDTSRYRSTMDRILEAWADTSPPSTSNNTHKTSQSVQEVTHLAMISASNALTWLEKLAATSKQYPTSTLASERVNILSPSSVNAVLTALGEVNNSPVNKDSKLVHKGEIIDIETTAKRLLGRLIDSAKCYEEIAAQPNVDTFNAYISCLRHPRGSSETAARAHTLLIDMLGQRDFEGLKLPLPNADTFNIVLKMWGSLPSHGRRKIDEIFSLMESSHLVEPNRDTFLIYLSSLPSTIELDPKYLSVATLMIEKMKKYQIKRGDEYTVNREVYNAPLPNISCFNLPRVRDNRFTPYPSSPDSVQTAESIERWIYDMERLAQQENEVDSAPDIRTYESAVLSWTLTGTRYGIARAEYWAHRAIKMASTDSEMTLRSQTFYPIINGWIYSGDEKSPEKVKQWLEKVFELNCIGQNINLDAITLEALVLTWRNYHRSLMAKSADESSRSFILERLFVAARECSQCLEKLFPEPLVTTDPKAIYGSSLKAVTDAWSDTCIFLSSYSTDPNTLSSLDDALRQLFLVVETVNRFSDCALTYPDETTSQEEKELIRQSTLIPGINIYMAVLRTVFKLAHSGNSVTLFLDSFPEVEWMMRRVIELSLILEMNSGHDFVVFHPQNDDRLFDLITLDSAQTPSVYAQELLDSLLSFLDTHSAPPYLIGDMIRVMNFLILHVGPSDVTVDKNIESLYKRIIKFIVNTVENEPERAILLYRLYNLNKSSASVTAEIMDCCPSITLIIEQNEHNDDKSSIHPQHAERKKIATFRRRRVVNP